MHTFEWLIIAATIAGPILAVQAQKWLERRREIRGRKNWVFNVLMATRAARLSTDHVQALNVIDLAFYGGRRFGRAWRTKREQQVLESWHEYLDHLGTKFDDKTGAVWGEKREQLYVNLLYAMAVEQGYSFDRVQISKGGYYPSGHSDVEEEQRALRHLQLELLHGRSTIKMDVASVPVDPEAVKVAAEMNKRLSDALSGKGALTVEVKQPE